MGSKLCRKTSVAVGVSADRCAAGETRRLRSAAGYENRVFRQSLQSRILIRGSCLVVAPSSNGLIATSPADQANGRSTWFSRGQAMSKSRRRTSGSRNQRGRIKGVKSARYCGDPFGDHGARYESRVTAALVVRAEHESYEL